MNENIKGIHGFIMKYFLCYAHYDLLLNSLKMQREVTINFLIKIKNFELRSDYVFSGQGTSLYF